MSTRKVWWGGAWVEIDGGGGGGFAPSSSAIQDSGIDTANTNLLTALATPGATNTKAATWTQLVASTPIAAGSVIVHVGLSNWGSGGLFDIATGGAGSEVVLFSNLAASMDNQAASTTSFVLPVPIAAGTRLSARAQVTRTDASPILAGVTLLPTSYGLGGVPYTWGANTADSAGVSLTAGTSRAKGSWVQVVASTDAAINWLVIAPLLTAYSANTANRFTLDIGIGGSGSETVLISDLPFDGGSNLVPVKRFTLPISVPAGSRLSARIASTTNSIVRDLVLYGIT